jgi:hypothetical protein
MDLLQGRALERNAEVPFAAIPRVARRWLTATASIIPGAVAGSYNDRVPATIGSRGEPRARAQARGRAVVRRGAGKAPVCAAVVGRQETEILALPATHAPAVRAGVPAMRVRGDRLGVARMGIAAHEPIVAPVAQRPILTSRKAFGHAGIARGVLGVGARTSRLDQRTVGRAGRRRCGLSTVPAVGGIAAVAAVATAGAASAARTAATATRAARSRTATAARAPARTTSSATAAAATARACTAARTAGRSIVVVGGCRVVAAACGSCDDRSADARCRESD